MLFLAVFPALSPRLALAATTAPTTTTSKAAADAALGNGVKAVTGPAATTAPAPPPYDKTGNNGLVQCGNQASNPCTVEDIFNIFIIATNLLVGLVGLFTIFAIVWAGSSMVWAAGNTEALTKAKKRLVNAIIGLVLVLLAFILINIVIYGVIGASGTNILSNPLQYIGLTSGSSAAPATPPGGNASGGG